LYDIPYNNAGTGNVTVDATGFNITCGYLPDIVSRFDPRSGGLGRAGWYLQKGGGNFSFYIESTGKFFNYLNKPGP
jgi:hypothetical protein